MCDFAKRENTDWFSDSDLNFYKLRRKQHDLNIKELSLDLNLSEKKDNKDRKLSNLTEEMKQHIRLAHVSVDYLRKLKDSGDKFKKITLEDDIRDCEACVLSKMIKKPSNKVRTSARKPLYCTHTDVIGPVKPLSFPDSKSYNITLIDDYLRYFQKYSIENKS